MKKEELKKYILRYAGPAVMVLVGALLIISPDTASALIAKVLGWCCIGVGVCCGFAAMSAVNRSRLVGIAVLCLGVGVFMTAFPLAIASILGRIVGIFLVLLGAGHIRSNLRKKEMSLVYRNGLILGVVQALTGVVLFLAPMTLSRILLNICGWVLAVVGILEGVSAYQNDKRLEGGADPNVIDAE